MRNAALAAAIVATCIIAPGTANAVASAELYKTQAYLYGRFEARIRFAAGDGVISSFFLWKDGSEAASTFWNELDFEKVGADCHMETNAIYGRPEVLHAQTNEMPGDICSEYHDYRFEWTPTYIAWAVDGKEIRRETGATADAFSQNATSGMTFRFNVWPGNANFGGNFSSSILPVREHISWVAYSSYNNGSFKFEWREDFNGTSLPSGWATGSWPSPYNLSTHNPANVTVANGIVTLSLTADNATGFTGTPPPDVSGSGTGGTTAVGTASGGTSTGGNGNRGGTSPTGGGPTARGGNATQSSDSEARNTGVGTQALGGVGNTVSGVTKGGSQNSRSNGGSSATPTSASVSAGGQSSVGSASRQAGGTRTTVPAASENSTQTARGGNTSTAQSSVESTEQGASSAAADAGCGCRISNGPEGTRSRAMFELIGLIGLLGTALRRRTRPSPSN
jgi:endo-1,3-1,4-beta-glycanase ExoK